MDTNKRLTWAVEKETEVEIQKKRRLRSPSSSIMDEDLQPCEDLQPQEGYMYSGFVHELGKLLPSCWLLWSQDWSYVLKYVDSSSSIYSSLLSELGSLCHWFLSTEAPEPFKNGANQALKLISSRTSLDTQMSIDHQSVSYSLEQVLDSKYALLIQQACCAIAFLCWCRSCNYFKDLSFGDGVVNKLFNLVEQDSLFRAYARRAICSIACVDKCMKNKIITKTKHDTRYRWPFLFGDTEEVEHACMIVACIVGGEKDDATWDKIGGVLIPPIVDVMRKAKMAFDIPVLVAAAYAISSAVDGATPEQIDKLFGMDCLEVLCNNLCVWSPPLTSHILDGIGHILEAGDEQGNKKYVDWIENDEKSPGWKAFRAVKDEFLFLPCFYSEARTSIEYRAYVIAYVYGGCKWAVSLLEEIYLVDDEF